MLLLIEEKGCYSISFALNSGFYVFRKPSTLTCNGFDLSAKDILKASPFGVSPENAGRGIFTGLRGDIGGDWLLSLDRDRSSKY